MRVDLQGKGLASIDAQGTVAINRARTRLTMFRRARKVAACTEAGTTVAHPGEANGDSCFCVGEGSGGPIE